VAQQRHVIDRVRTRDHPRDQTWDLQMSIDPTRRRDPHMFGDQPLQPSAFGELQHRSQTSARHEVGVIEYCGDSVRDSHLRGALRA
jgi:hypothetical protein